MSKAAFAIHLSVSDRIGSLIRNLRERPALYAMVLPGVVFFVLFRIVPNAGVVIAFQDYSILRGVLDSPWVGLEHFRNFFLYPDFARILRNTAIIAGLRLIIAFPAPIILALLLNEVRVPWYRRTVQTLVYFPHFLSWVIVSQIFINILSPQGGIVNQVYTAVTGNEPVYFMIQEWFFRPIVLISTVWKTAGFSSILYLAAISAISPELYEAAAIDGATRWQQLWRITLPSIAPTIIVLLLLNIANFLELGFEQIWTLANPLVWPVADVFDTYVYRRGVLEGEYSLTSAIGLFKSVVSFLLLVIADRAAKRVSGEGLL